ncbi:hypothetical protein M2260_005546 [Rhodococcus erythropolis]|uniref:Rv1476 family membrane protein n=1 Tax=Rhodococcus erythropolis TaxID=1833 RepID=UPI002226088C|nr:DUF6676 family protein [Rhodococcus erythropolis]MCW2430638.1 hypothetical protein [Rhodococcus erythropolis]
MSAPTNHAFAPVHVKSPLHVAVPSDVDLDDVLADLSTDGVSAPESDVVGLTAVVTDARERGVDLSVVVVDANPGRPSDLRDLATTVGKTEGGTVIVLSPDWMGSYSDSISRVQLETAQDRSFGESASVTADRFSHEIVAPGSAVDALHGPCHRTGCGYCRNYLCRQVAARAGKRANQTYRFDFRNGDIFRPPGRFRLTLVLLRDFQ